MSSKIFGGAAFAFVVGLAFGPIPASAAPVYYHISFTDTGTYGVNGAQWNGSAVATASFDILFDPTQLYLTQPIAGIITNLTYSVTDNRFNPAALFLNGITEFAFDGAGTLTLYSNSALNKSLAGTSDITIGINGWAYNKASSVWYSQPDFRDTLTTSGAVDIAVATPLPAALPLFASGLGALGVLTWRRRRKTAA